MIFMGLIILCVVAYVTIDIDLIKMVNNESLRIVVELLKYYITATLAEIIGILFFIVKKLFS